MDVIDFEGTGRVESEEALLGFQSRSHATEEGDVHFLQPSGDKASSFDLPTYTVVDLNHAYAATAPFLKQPSMPRVIEWFEL